MIFCRIRGKWLLTDELRRGIIEDKRWNFCSIYFVKMNQIFQKAAALPQREENVSKRFKLPQGRLGIPRGKSMR